MGKLLKVLLALILVGAIMIAAAMLAYALITRNAVLDENKLTDYGRSVIVCDADGKEITSASIAAKRKSVKLEDLDKDTVNAFIASEDRAFYRHNGLNYKRMAKALMVNLTSRSIKEGASTISQQLIKNTHLSGDKTIERKLKEIKLTKKLEKKYSKDEILEMYLNTIYFGHNCYGLESAAEFYFGTTAENLNLERSAMLAGLLTSPNNLSPFKNPEKCIARRNLVLKCMSECGFIDQESYKAAVKSDLSAEKPSDSGGTDAYLGAVFSELEGLVADSYLKSGKCRVVTFMDREVQNLLDKIETESDAAMIVTSQFGGVRAYRSSAGEIRRQPGSTIKPLLVYAPAIEEKMLCPSTKIEDRLVNFGGYSPENYDGKYHGYVTCTEALCMSYNVPAVKILNSLTLAKAEKYAKKLGITLEDGEKNLSLALGGMRHGLTLEELVEKYRAFIGGGAYTKTAFIKNITVDGHTIYSAKEQKTEVFSQGTASLINGMLKETAKTGTAKKLKDLNFDVAAKTGTCGRDNGNTDAWCIAYTSADCIGVWMGDRNNRPIDTTGGGACCSAAKEILQALYKTSRPALLDCTSGTEEISIDRDEYNDNNKIVLAEEIAPKLSIKKIRILSGNLPTEHSTKYSTPSIEKPQIKTENQSIFIQLCYTKYYSYLIKRENEGKNVTIYDGEWTETFEDSPGEGTYIYSIIPYYFDGTKKHYGATIKLPAVNTNTKSPPPQKDVPDIARRDWFNE